MNIDNYIDDGTKYCHNVLSGKILAGEKIKQACQRHLSDLERIGNNDFPYYYSQQIVKGAIRFVQTIPDIDTKKRLDVQPFQRFILSQILGWRKGTPDNDKGKRFRKVYLSMARTNGKTQLDSWLMLYDFYFGTPRYNRQLCCAANSNDQANKLLDYISSSVETLQATNKLFANYAYSSTNQDGVQILWNKIKWEKYHTSISRISPAVNNIDSNHFTTAVVDEGHQLKDDSMIGKISSGQVNQPEALLIESSTAGLDPKVPLHSEYELLCDILSGKKQNDRQLVIIYEQDNVSEIDKPEMWEKSNPLLCYQPTHDSRLDGLIAERDDKIAAGKKEEFIVKNMNMWQNARVNRYINLSDWEENTLDKFNINEHICYIGYDKQMTQDDTAFAFVFPYTDTDGIRKFFISQHSFIPTQKEGSIEAKELLDGIPYRKYPQFCDITRNSYGIISDDQCYSWLLDFATSHKLRVAGFVYDSWHADRLTKALENNTDWKLIPLRQGTISLNMPTTELRNRLIDRTVKHLNDKIMTAGFMNAVTVSDNNGIKVDKDSNSQKIDCVDAVIDAFSVAMYHWENYPDDSDDILDLMTPEQLNEYYQSDDFGF